MRWRDRAKSPIEMRLFARRRSLQYETIAADATPICGRDAYTKAALRGALMRATLASLAALARRAPGRAQTAVRMAADCSPMPAVKTAGDTRNAFGRRLRLGGMPIGHDNCVSMPSWTG